MRERPVGPAEPSVLLIADHAGGDWPQRARDAAQTMTGAEAQHEEDTSASVRLLTDLRDLYDQVGADALYTSTLLERLHKLDEAPYATPSPLGWRTPASPPA